MDLDCCSTTAGHFVSVLDGGIHSRCCLFVVRCDYTRFRFFPPPPPAQIWNSRPFHLLLIHRFCLFISALNRCTFTQVMNACAVLSWWWWSVLTGWVAHLPGWWSGNLSSYLSGSGCCPVQTHNKSFWMLSHNPRLTDFVFTWAQRGQAVNTTNLTYDHLLSWLTCTQTIVYRATLAFVWWWVFVQHFLCLFLKTSQSSAFQFST